MRLSLLFTVCATQLSPMLCSLAAGREKNQNVDSSKPISVPPFKSCQKGSPHFIPLLSSSIFLDDFGQTGKKFSFPKIIPFALSLSLSFAVLFPSMINALTWNLARNEIS